MKNWFLILIAMASTAFGQATFVPRSIKELDDARGVSLVLKFTPIYDGTKFTPRALLEGDITSLVSDLAAKQPLDSDLTSIAALATTSFGRGSLALADAAAFRTYIGAGSSSFDGTFASLTGKPTTLAGYGIVDAQPLDSDLTIYAGITPSANVQSILGAANYVAMKTLLSLTIGTDVQAYDADLTTYAGITPSANVQTLLGSATYAAMRTQLALTIGTDVQAYDADLTTYAGITPSANVQTFLGAANYAAMKTQLALTIGTDVQAFDSDLTTWAGITPGTGVATFLATNAGTSAQYVRGDLSLQTLNQAAVAGLTTASSPTFTGVTLSGGTLTGSGSTLVLNGGSGDAVSSTAFQSTNGYFKSPSSTNINIHAGTGGDVYLNPRGTTQASFTNTGATIAGNLTVSGASAASTPAELLQGAWYAAGTGTTNFPHLLLQATGTTASTTWSTAGTGIGANAVTGFTGSLIDLKLAGTTIFKVTAGGAASGLTSLGTSAQITASAGNAQIYGPSNGVIRLSNTAGSAPTRINFSNDSNSFPAITGDAINGFTLQSAAGTATWNDPSTANSGTVANRYLFGIAAPTLTSTGTSVTNTVASTVYIGGAPTDSTNTTSTTKYALNVAAGVVKFGGGTVILPAYTVATLPSTAVTGKVAGAMAYVTDATTPTYNGVLTGGGAVAVPVFCDGTNWTSH